MKIFKLVVLLVFVSYSLLSCTHKADEIAKPDNLIAKDTLISMFHDIHLIDASFSVNGIDGRHDSTRFKMYQSMFNKYSRTEDDFNQSMRYYILNDIIKLNEMYNDVLARFSHEKEMLTTKIGDQ